MRTLQILNLARLIADIGIAGLILWIYTENGMPRLVETGFLGMLSAAFLASAGPVAFAILMAYRHPWIVGAEQ